MGRCPWPLICYVCGIYRHVVGIFAVGPAPLQADLYPVFQRGCLCACFTRWCPMQQLARVPLTVFYYIAPASAGCLSGRLSFVASGCPLRLSNSFYLQTAAWLRALAVAKLPPSVIAFGLSPTPDMLVPRRQFQYPRKPSFIIDVSYPAGHGTVVCLVALGLGRPA
jgi:hypothetical protein